MPDSFTILDGGEIHRLEARLDGERVRLDARSLQEQLGWKLRPQGLCRGDVCIPVPDRTSLVSDEGLDLERLAELWDRPLALDAGERCAALGEGHRSRAADLASLEAPDFELPDLEGRRHRLSDQRGKKVLLIAYASW